MYKIATDLAQRRSRQLWLADLQQDGFLKLTAEEQRESLKAKMFAIEREILSLPESDPYRLELGQAKFELQNAMRAIRAKMKGPPTVPSFFMEVARRKLTKPVFNSWMTEATRLAREATEKLPDQTTAEQKS